MNCPFYGYALYTSQSHERVDPPFVMFAQDGNQCALVATAHAPCQMEVKQQTPDWQRCYLVQAAQGRDS